MTDQPTVATPFRQALEAEDWNRLEELWLEALEESQVPTTELLELRRLLWKAGKKDLAGTLLELLTEVLEERGDFAAAAAALREQVRLTEKPDAELLGRLEQAVARARTDCPTVAAVLDRYRLVESRRPIPPRSVQDHQARLGHR